MQSDTSYLNYKKIGLMPSVLPIGDSDDALARAFGNFFGDGTMGLIVSDLTYWGLPIEKVTPAELKAWKKNSNGEWLKDTSTFPADVGCIHPRKMAVADFNQDGKPDVFVACHGYDYSPFPGEKNKLISSGATGYSVADASNDIGYFHSVSAADINDDGYPDVVVSNNQDPISSVHFLINNRAGKFTKDYSISPKNLGSKSIFSVELVDVNGDGWLDLIAGGHEWEGGNGMVFINPKTNDFSAVSPIMLPVVPNEGVILDFTITENDGKRSIWVMRSSGGDGSFYQSATVQKISWPDMASSVEYMQRPKKWRPWLIPALLNGSQVITTDNIADCISIAVNPKSESSNSSSSLSGDNPQSNACVSSVAGPTGPAGTYVAGNAGEIINQLTLNIGDGSLLKGGAGNDEITFWNANVQGSAGNDIFRSKGAWGAVVYWDSPKGIRVNLAAGKAEDGFGGADTFIDVKNIHGSPHDDVIVGDERANTFHGLGGNDQFDGGGGFDTVSYYFVKSTDATVSYDKTTDTWTIVKNFASDKGTDVLKNIDEVHFSGEGSDNKKINTNQTD